MAKAQDVDLSRFAGRKGAALTEMTDEELTALGDQHEWNQRRAGDFLNYARGGGASRAISMAWEVRLGRTAQGKHTTHRGGTLTAPAAPGSLSPLATDLLAYLQKHRDQPLDPTALADHFDRGPSAIRAAAQELDAAGYTVAGEAEHITLPSVPTRTKDNAPDCLKGTELVIGGVSDTHLGSTEAASDVLEELYDRFAAEGCQAVLHAGDVGGGSGQVGYRGHYLEMRPDCLTPEGLLAHLVASYPRRPGLTTFAVSGNHDLWDWKRTGFDLVKMMGQEREDLHYCGQEQADLLAGPERNTRLRLYHPGGSSAYAKSYRAQKYVENLIGGSKPHLLLMGHFHQAGWFLARNIEILMMGCTEWQTSFLAGKGIEPQVGGYLIKLSLDPDGWIKEFSPRWFAHYYPT